MSQFKKIKTCVNCRHLEILDEGKIVENLDDTSYIAFRCNVFNYSAREVFRFPKASRELVIERELDECPFWEEWVKESETVVEETGSSAKSMLEPDDY